MQFEWYEQSRLPMTDTQPTLRAGKWDVGFISYDWSSKAKAGERHVAYTMLPGLKQHQGYFKSKDAAKARVEEVTRYWLDKMVNYVPEGYTVTTPATRRVSRSPQRRDETEAPRVRRTRSVAPPTQRIRRVRSA